MTTTHLPAIPCGLVVRIRRSHRRGRGSIPRMGEGRILFLATGPFFFQVTHSITYSSPMWSSVLDLVLSLLWPEFNSPHGKVFSATGLPFSNPYTPVTKSNRLVFPLA